MFKFFDNFYNSKLANWIAPQKQQNPLEKAVTEGNLSACVEVLQSPDGSSYINAKTSQGNSYLHIACYHGHTEIARLLVESGQDINAVGTGNNTPLHFAAAQGHRSTADYLLSSGANVQLKNSQGQNAYDVTSKISLRQHLLSYLFPRDEAANTSSMNGYHQITSTQTNPQVTNPETSVHPSVSPSGGTPGSFDNFGVESFTDVPLSSNPVESSPINSDVGSHGSAIDYSKVKADGFGTSASLTIGHQNFAPKAVDGGPPPPIVSNGGPPLQGFFANRQNLHAKKHVSYFKNQTIHSPQPVTQPQEARQHPVDPRSFSRGDQQFTSVGFGGPNITIFSPNNAT